MTPPGPKAFAIMIWAVKIAIAVEGFILYSDFMMGRLPWPF